MQAQAPHSGADQEPSRISGLSRLAWVIVLLLLLYFLSIGPAGKMYDHGFLPGSAFLTAYGPLFWFAHAFQPFAFFLGWYLYILWDDHISM
jgi:hypothetical protein